MCYISAMFLLFLNIDHLKLIKRNTTFQIDKLLETTQKVVKKWGGVTSSISPYLSFHPDGYQHSKEWFIHCINETAHYLQHCSELVGFTLLINKSKNQEEDEIFDQFKTMNLGVFSVDGIWGKSDIVRDLNIVDFTKKHGLYRITNPINIKNMWSSVDALSELDIVKIDTGRFELKKGIDYITCRSLEKWGLKSNIEKFLYFNFDDNIVSKFKFLKYLMAKESDFNPLTDLDNNEVVEWGMYLELYRSLLSRDKSAYVLDSPGIHLKKLIDLWLESYCKRYKVQLLINTSGNTQAHEIFSVENLLLVTAVNTNNSIHESIYYIDQLNNDILRILYYALITEGFLIIDELAFVLEKSGYNRIDIIDTLEFFRIKGFFWGDEVLYVNNSSLLPYVINKCEENIKFWHNDLILNLAKLSDDILVERLLVEKCNESDSLDSNIVLTYINTFIDMGISIDNCNKFPSPLDQYYIKRVSRVIKKNFLENVDIKSLELHYLSVQNKWTLGAMDDLVVDSKNIYMKYQQLGDKYNECRSKVLFSLCLMADGRIDEAIDYLELNATYSLTINDRYSYIRSSCYLMCAMLNKGNLTGVIRVFNNISKWNWVKLKTKWYIYSLFLVSRSYCELGKYEEAISFIILALNEADDKGYKNIKRVLRNWQGLYYLYNNQPLKALDVILSIELSKESYLFLSEIEFLNGDLIKSKKYIDIAKSMKEEQFICDEDLIWRSGFFVVEDLYIRGDCKTALDKEVDCFYWFINTLTENEDFSGNLQEFVTKIPNDSLFVRDYKILFYLYKLLIESKTKTSINKDKLIDKSVRLMQLRGNNIDSHNKKVNYYMNFWNKIIIEYKRKKLF